MNRVTYWLGYVYICLACGIGASWVLEHTDGDWVVYSFYMLGCVICLGIIDGDGK